MNSRLYTQQPGDLARVSRPHRRTVQMLKDLIRVNKDRITGYEKAAESPVRNTLYRMAIASRSYVNDLHAEVIRFGGSPVTQDSITGKIYLFWLDQKADFAGKYSEVAIQKAYRHALDNGGDCPDHIRLLLERQLGDLEHSLEELEQALEEIKNVQNDQSNGL